MDLDRSEVDCGPGAEVDVVVAFEDAAAVLAPVRLPWVVTMGRNRAILQWRGEEAVREATCVRLTTAIDSHEIFEQRGNWDSQGPQRGPLVHRARR